MSGLSVSRVVKATIDLSPTGAQVRNFGSLLIGGDSNVISGLERYRSYTQLTDVATDFGTSAPEYLAAALYYGQSPQPTNLLIGRWLRVATAGFINGGILTPTQQLLTNFTSVTSGGFHITIDSVVKSLLSIDLSSATNLTDVATAITTALSGAVCTWTGQRFVITSPTTGASSSVSFATAPASGTDISTLLQLTLSLASPVVPGYASETAVQFAAALANLTSAWYGLMFAASTMPNDAANILVCSFIEALTVTRIFGVTTQEPAVLDSTQTTDMASLMQQGGYNQSFCQYSSTQPYVVASMFGRAFSVDFNSNNSTLTLMFKQEPGVTAEILSNTQADTLQAKRCNVFVAYENNTNILQYGVMSGTSYFDETQGLDWFQNRLQTDEYNLLYTSTTKIPQTDDGVGQLINTAQGSCDAAVFNGLCAPGVWNGPNIGQLKTGQYLKSGYYIFAPPIGSQSQGDRDARKSPPITVCIKLAGAIQEIDLVIQVNR